MRCPSCDENALSVRQRLLVAARAQSQCPACGVAIRFGFWPRLVHVLLGDAILVVGAIGAYVWDAPFLVPLALGSWLSLAVLLPVEAGPQ